MAAKRDLDVSWVEVEVEPLRSSDRTDTCSAVDNRGTLGGEEENGEVAVDVWVCKVVDCDGGGVGVGGVGVGGGGGGGGVDGARSVGTVSHGTCNSFILAHIRVSSSFISLLATCGVAVLLDRIKGRRGVFKGENTSDIVVEE